MSRETTRELVEACCAAGFLSVTKQVLRDPAGGSSKGKGGKAGQTEVNVISSNGIIEDAFATSVRDMRLAIAKL
jgi:hypothetical protein